MKLDQPSLVDNRYRLHRLKNRFQIMIYLVLLIYDYIPVQTMHSPIVVIIVNAKNTDLP